LNHEILINLKIHNSVMPGSLRQPQFAQLLDNGKTRPIETGFLRNQDKAGFGSICVTKVDFLSKVFSPSAIISPHFNLASSGKPVKLLS